MTEPKLNETALAAAYKAYGHPGKTLTPIQDAIRAYLSSDPDRAARDAVVAAAMELSAKVIECWTNTESVHARDIADELEALTTAVAALPKEGE